MIDLDGFDDGPSPSDSAADAAAEHASDRPKPRRGNAHPNFTPKDELRRRLEVAEENAAWEREARLVLRKKYWRDLVLTALGVVIVFLMIALFGGQP